MRRATWYNVIAAFPATASGTVTVELARRGIPESAITVHRPGEPVSEDHVSELEAEMQDQLNAAWGPASGPQARGALTAAVAFGLAGVVAGLVAGVLWAYGSRSVLSPLARIAIAVGVLGLGGATVGLVVGGSGLERPHGEERDTGTQPEVAERDVLVAVHVDDRVAADRAATAMRDLGAERIHLVDRHGVPLPPQASHPRPADPDGYWWRHAGEG